MEGINVEVIEPGSADDPFGSGASDQASNAASSSPDATGVAGGAGGVSPDDTDIVDIQVDALDEDDAGEDADDDEGEELTPEELNALDELRAVLLEEAQNKIVPQIQSTYDKQLAAAARQIRELQQAQATREMELRNQLREAELNGLPDAEKEKMKAVWAFEDRQAALDAREQELTGYHTELLRAAYAQEYAEFGLTAEDLEEYGTPEEMDEFVREVQLEYYKQLAQMRQAAPAAEAAPEAATTRARPQAQQRKAPAGASAPSDSGGGAAVPEAPKFNSGRGIGAMAENLRNGGWETAKIG